MNNDRVLGFESMRAPIMLAEDEDTDVFLFRHALTRAGIPHELVVVGDGAQAVEYLSRFAAAGHSPAAPMPALLLLDLNMPRMTGFEVLAWLRVRDTFKTMPTVVLTSSHLETDRQLAFALGAVDYRVKPNSVNHLIEVVREIHDRWLSGSRPSTID